MTIAPGRHELGPENGTLWVRTGRAGAAAVAGHDLLIRVTAWEATLDVGEDPAQASIVFSADSSSLRVHEGVGGMQELVEEDKDSIQQTIDDEVLQGTAIEFRSTAVDGAADGRWSVQGDLTLAGNTRPLEFDLVVGDDESLGATVILKQSTWGMTPYSALFGALKVADEVEIVVNASLRADSGQAEQPAWSGPWSVAWEPGPIVDPRVSSALWALLFFFILWLGMAAVGVARGTAFVLAVVAACFIFLFVRTQGIGRQDTTSGGQSR